MLTDHEQLADHEARISRQELPPLQQPLDNIEQIKGQLEEMHRARTCGEITAEQVALAVLPGLCENPGDYGTITGLVCKAFVIGDEFIRQMNRRKNA